MKFPPLAARNFFLFYRLSLVFPLLFRLQNSVRLLSYVKPILRKKKLFLLSIFLALYYTCFQVFLGVPECSVCRLLFETDSSCPDSQSRTQSPLLAGIYVQREGKRMVHGMVIPPIFCLVSRLQNSPYFRVSKYARTVKQD